MTDYDLVIVGAGSGNMIPAPVAEAMRVAIVERGRFGGTCLNRGCIPSKMLLHAAEVADTISRAGRFGVRAELIGADWPALRDRVFSRLDHDSDETLAGRRRSGVDVYVGEARFVGDRTLDVDGQSIHAERMVLAAGSRPTIPEIPGLADVAFHTTDTVMRIDALPASMVIVGGGSVAAEIGYLFGALGTEITMIERAATLLNALDPDVALRFTECVAERFDVRLRAEVTRVERTASGVAVHITGGDHPAVVEADTLLVAVGRSPNSDVLDVAAGGIAVDPDGRVVTDAMCATNVPGVWAIGDLVNHTELKHLANAQMRVVMHNLLHPDAPRRADFAVLPAAVFSDPQIATVGPTEPELQASGAPYVVARHNYSDTAWGWALEDTTGFVKLIADPATRRLVAAHIIGPQAATLVQTVVQAISLDNTVDHVAKDVLYIHPAPNEVVAQALLDLVKALAP